MNLARFQSARQKLERAQLHIRDLESAFQRFVNNCPYSVIVAAERKGGGFVDMRVEIDFAEALPPELSLIAGDALHCLWCAMDHCTWELVSLAGGLAGRKTKTPSGGDQSSFAGMVKGMQNTPSSVIGFLTDLQIYPGGRGAELYSLKQLDVDDKHKAINAVAHAASLKDLIIFDLATQERLILEEVSTVPTSDLKARCFSLNEGYGIDPKNKYRLKPEIFFGNETACSSEALLPALRTFEKTVAETVRAFAEFGEAIAAATVPRPAPATSPEPRA